MSWDIEAIVAELRSVRARSKRVGLVNDRSDFLPTSAKLGDIVRGITSALFPRHSGAQVRNVAETTFFVGHELTTALHSLREQIAREFAFAGEQPGDSSSPPASLTPRELVTEFASGLPKIYELLEADIQAAYDGDPSARSTEEVLLSFPGIKAILHHRLAHALYVLGAPVTARIISELSHSATGIDIHPGAQIGASFFIDHGTGVVIGETAIIGDRVRIYQAVTLGAKSFPTVEDGTLQKGRARHPVVEDDVVIYAGATILGRVTIGRGSTIGGNVWLTRSVPPSSNVFQAEARAEIVDARLLHSAKSA